MKASRAYVLCAVMLTASTVMVHGQAYPTRLSLTRTTVNDNVLVKTKITEKDIIARCASDQSVDPARLQFFYTQGGFVVIDMVTSNVTCSIATLDGDYPANVVIDAYSGTSSNKLSALAFFPINSTGEAALPADFAGTIYMTYTATITSNDVTSLKLKGVVQGGSSSNNAVYSGTMTISGKVFVLPRG